jgi:hypothetical protein
MAASKPMIATTIMISTRVNALLREVLSCICYLTFLTKRREHGRGGLNISCLFTIAFCRP